MNIKYTLRLASVALLLLAGPATADVLTFQEVGDNETGYQTQVTHIRGTSTTPSDPSSNMQVGRTVNAGDYFRGLLGYDISAIPAGATITSVTLTVTHRRPDTGMSRSEDVEYQLHQLNGTFTESQATWTERSSGVPWTTPGGDFNPTPLSTMIDNPEGAGKYLRVFESTPSFVAAAQAALNGGQDLNLLIRSAFAEGLPDGQRSLVNFVSDDQDASTFPVDAPLLTIDFISPFGGLEANIDRTTGNISLRNPSPGTLQNVIAYSLTSEHGALDSTKWRPIATLNASVDPDGDWTILSDPADATDLSELETSGTSGANIAPNQVINLGNAWIKSTVEDVMLQVLIDDGSATGKVESYPVNFLPGSGGFTGYEFGDLDFDGDIDAQDFQNVFVPAYLSDTSGLSVAQAYRLGDLNDDGTTDIFDFLAFNSLYKAANPGAASLVLPGVAVPEPASVALLMMFLAAPALVAFRRLALSAVAVRAAIIGCCLSVAGSASAVTVRNLTTGQLLFFDDFESAPQTTPFEFGAPGNETIDADPVVPAGSPAGSSWFGPYRSITSDPLPESEEVIDITQVTTSSSGLDPGPIQGTNYLRTTRTATSGQTFAHPVFAEQSTLGNVISMRAMIYTPAGNTSQNGAGIAAWGKDNLGNTVIVISTQYSGGGTVVNSDGTSGTTNTSPVAGLSYVPGQWNFVQYDYHVGENKFDLTVNNNKVTDLPLRNTDQANLVSLTSFGFAGNVPDGTNSRTMYVDAVPELSLTVNKATGEMRVINQLGEDVELSAYRITSATPGAFLANALNGFDGNNYDGSGTWTELASSTQHLAEAALGDSTFGNTDSVSLGNVYNTATGAEDLVFEYHLAGTHDSLLIPSTRITYLTAGGLSGDFNLDGTVDAADYVLWRNHVGQSEAILNGNGNGNGVVDGLDYSLWKDNYGETSPGALATSAASVPEPSGIALALAGLALAWHVRRRRSPHRVAIAVVTLTSLGMLASPALAVVTPDRHYSMGDYNDGSFFENGANNGPVGSNAGGSADVLDGEIAGIPSLADLDAMGDPVYASVASGTYARPGATGFGIRFDGTDDILTGSPLNTLTATQTSGLQMWVYPDAAKLGNGRQVIVSDTSNAGGPAITASGLWTQNFSNHPNDTAIVPTVPVVGNTWHHVAQHIWFNSDTKAPDVVPGTGNPATYTSVLYVNGVAVSASNDGSVTAPVTTFQVGGYGNTAGDFFQGVMDELKVYTSGPNDFNLFADNEFIAAAIAAIPGGMLRPGDVNRDGQITQGSGNPLTDDVAAFVAGWKNEKVFQGAHNSVTLGDWETWGWGDMNTDGRVDLFDAYILHDALQGAGAGGLDFARLTAGAQVPEPATLWVIGSALVAVGLARRRLKRA